MDENGGNLIPTDEEPEEPDLIKCNQVKLGHFRRLGLFLVYWKKTKYEVCQWRLLLYYLIWYLSAIACFALAYIFKEVFQDKEYIDRVDDLIEASFVGILVGILPACWIYLLREYNTYLPRILMITSKLEKTEMYKELDIAKNCEISYMEGWLEEDYNDSDDEVNLEIPSPVKNQWWLVKYGPYIGIILSIFACFILIIVSLIWNFCEIIWEKPANSLKHLKREIPFFIMSILYPIPYFVSIWFCIFFLEWQRKIHESVRCLIRTIKKSSSEKNSTGDTKLTEENKRDLESISCMLNKVQKVFILINKKIFQKTIVIDFIFFIFLGAFCCWKVIQDASYLAYIIPLSLLIGHIYLACKWSNDLMKEFNETIEVLNEMHEEDIKNLRRELNECPPQVLAFGGFNVNYSMMTAVLASIISIIGFTELIWPEDNQHCYRYLDSVGEWNHTLCIKYKLFIRVNETLSLRNLVD